jgi:thiol-disulfide isomerase/thioredoxin
MAVIALGAVAGLGRLLRSARGLAVLAFGAAAGLWLLPGLEGAGGAPAGLALAASSEAVSDAEFRTAGGEHRTLADFRGRVVLLNLWATWCGPCVAEMPSLDRLQALHQGDGLTVLAVSVDKGGGAAVQRFFEQRGLRNLTPYLDANGATVRAFGARRIPTTLIIDRDGKVVGSLIGPKRWDSPDTVALIRRYLAS